MPRRGDLVKSLPKQGLEPRVIGSSRVLTEQIFGFLRTFLRIGRPVHIQLELMLDRDKEWITRCEAAPAQPRRFWLWAPD